MEVIAVRFMLEFSGEYWLNCRHVILEAIAFTIIANCYIFCGDSGLQEARIPSLGQIAAPPVIQPENLSSLLLIELSRPKLLVFRSLIMLLTYEGFAESIHFFLVF